LLALSALLMAACSRDEVTIGQSPLLRFIEPKSGRIAVMGTDGNIYTMDQAGGGLVAVTEDAVIPDETQGLVRYYQFPAWAPDDSRLAFIGYQGNDQFATTTSVFTTAPDGSNIVQAFSSGQYLPRNLYWSPDGEWLTFLTSTSGSTASALQLVPAAGGEATKLDAGNPFYWSWAPDARSMIVHAGGSGLAPRSRLAFLNVDGGIYEEGMALRPARFQAPAWSPDGTRFLVAVLAGDQAELVMTSRDGSVYRVLGRAAAGIDASLAFAWSPNGKLVAHVTRSRIDGEVQGDLRLVALEERGGEDRAVTEGQVVLGFFWSPNSRKIAYFVPGFVSDPNDDQQPPTLFLTLYVHDVRKGTGREIASFVPTSQFLSVVQQFDQYYLTARVWSPDSRNIVFAALSQAGPGIVVAKAEGNIAPRRVVDGLIGFWSWR
jgi:Tol biopolymer transport system component